MGALCQWVQGCHGAYKTKKFVKITNGSTVIKCLFYLKKKVT